MVTVDWKNVIIDSHIDIETKDIVMIRYCSQNMHKLEERVKITRTNEVNRIYYYDCPTHKYV